MKERNDTIFILYIFYGRDVGKKLNRKLFNKILWGNRKMKITTTKKKKEKQQKS